MTGGAGPLVSCAGVARTFGSGPNAVVAVHGINCIVDRGDRIAISGASGSGKSTLVHLMAGLDLPSAGTVTWPALGDRAALRPGPVAVVFQGLSLVPALDSTENVALPLLLAGLSKSAARDAALRALEALDLLALKDRISDELSGGQAQRVAVARALAGEPDLVLADEPTGQLDQASAKHLIDVLFQTAHESGAALVVSTHDQAVAERFRTTWKMADGALLAPEGT